MLHVWYWLIGCILFLSGCLDLKERVPDQVKPISLCGNENIDPSEECDDGNQFDGDGCSQNCIIEDLCNGVDEDRDGMVDETHFNIPRRMEIYFTSTTTHLGSRGVIEFLDQNQMRVLGPLGTEDIKGKKVQIQGHFFYIRLILDDPEELSIGYEIETIIDQTGRVVSGPYPSFSNNRSNLVNMSEQIQLFDAGDSLGAGRQCGTNTGVCQLGQLACIDGKLECQNARTMEDETCDGLDNDCDGLIDEALSALAENQLGVCRDSLKICKGVEGWIEPMYTEIEEYSESDSTCDGLDNDCDGLVDESPIGPLADKQDGVCQGSMKVCIDQQWIEPMYMEIEGYSESDILCDGIDSDCDGSFDEDVDPTSAPLTENQNGVCLGALKICNLGWIDFYEDVEGYEDTPYESNTSDLLDNNCDGVVDEATPPCHPQCPDLHFIRIEGGNFEMGTEDWDGNEQPIHSVRIPSFEIMQNEITVVQYRSCVDANFCSPPEELEIGITWSRDPEKDQYPMNKITWSQLNTFAEWVGARLPTEAEWEYAARSKGEVRTYPWGEEYPSCTYAVMSDIEPGCNANEPSPICSKRAGDTRQGLCDMVGNLAEWVQDEYHDNYLQAPNDGSGWCSLSGCPPILPPQVRVVRGGHWQDSQSRFLRSASRVGRVESEASINIGGRLARVIR